MTPRPFITFVAISVGTSVAIAILMAVMGWTVNSPGWAGLAPIVMWAPALGSLIARRMEPALRRNAAAATLGKHGVRR